MVRKDCIPSRSEIGHFFFVQTRMDQLFGVVLTTHFFYINVFENYTYRFVFINLHAPFRFADLLDLASAFLKRNRLKCLYVVCGILAEIIYVGSSST